MIVSKQKQPEAYINCTLLEDMGDVFYNFYLQNNASFEEEHIEDMVYYEYNLPTISEGII